MTLNREEEGMGLRSQVNRDIFGVGGDKRGRGVGGGDLVKVK